MGFVGTVVYKQHDAHDRATVGDHDSDDNSHQRITKARLGGSSALRHHAHLDKAISDRRGAAGARRHDGSTADEFVGTVSSDAENEHVMYVKGYINGILVYSLMDTGSVVSIMNKDVFDKLCAVQNIALSPPPDGHLRGVGQGRVEVLGLAENVPVQLCKADGRGEQIAFSDDFLVCDGIATDCLMGTRFQRKYRARIDADSCTLILDNGITPSKHALVKRNGNTDPVAVYVQEEYFIPARSQCFLRCCLSGEQSDLKRDWHLAQQVLFTPTAQMHNRYKLLIANCITSLSGDCLAVHVINATEEDVRLRAGVNCGTVEACADIVFHTVTGERHEKDSKNRYANFCYMTHTVDDNPNSRRSRAQFEINESDKILKRRTVSWTPEENNKLKTVLKPTYLDNVHDEEDEASPLGDRQYPTSQAKRQVIPLPVEEKNDKLSNARAISRVKVRHRPIRKQLATCSDSSDEEVCAASQIISTQTGLVPSLKATASKVKNGNVMGQDKSLTLEQEPSFRRSTHARGALEQCKPSSFVFYTSFSPRAGSRRRDTQVQAMEPTGTKSAVSAVRCKQPLRSINMLNLLCWLCLSLVLLQAHMGTITSLSSALGSVELCLNFTSTCSS
jgi:hypothetical protein